MLKEQLKISTKESEKDFDKKIREALELELQKMQERNPERNDAKFTILKQFLCDLENQSFKDAFGQLRKQEKHTIITRLENQAEHMGGEIPYDFIYNLEREVYGVVRDQEGEMINLEKKAQLEKLLQGEN